ncbi:hypothetical protein CcaverHIS002_0402810 [Cutaneotrichosporon cavernicola]|uniref:Cx9C motif-containing protein 4, mitochondrial n=1 Tax=Cutaneotrichosporon cavernicola TaxID=279322 RepID=A0AA48QVR9_9TREE|nr:uncharacterized protein CcaverHIS019_0402770 [Cutaneotrichosporon cavernicola]BEI83677.1 hypothetical protein CcaverHIS002_0402810 [Cutaneotrichosporon cavernicola]BEI91457.1 hypothetical protein CcaverHIS019_0402770 [Cutaneotrichosporon cavernicola]BEI99231.1 hypothetical protein CcaverHIS631_0402740 [Cutaneotrichosporon cavernicola]BEJ07008.1 hypothetical protein CcaverHIS641_0402770 [Cutaneotrichosporon cavernicola]
MGNFLHPDQGGAADFNCNAEAGAIKTCLQAQTDQAKCTVAIKDLYQCCAAMWLTHARTGERPQDVKDSYCPLPPELQALLRKQ